TRREDRQDLPVMQLVRRGDVDRLDRRVGEQVIERRVAARDVEGGRALRAALRARSEHARDPHADAPQRLGVDGPDEAAPDDGGADLTSSGQTPVLHSAPGRNRVESLADAACASGRPALASSAAQPAGFALYSPTSLPSVSVIAAYQPKPMSVFGVTTLPPLAVAAARLSSIESTVM